MGTPAGDIIAAAEKELGKPYVYGAVGPSAFDCSGLVRYAFLKYGISLPHKAELQAHHGKVIDKNSILPGDLVFSDWGDGTYSHVGIAVSSTRIIVAPKTGDVVKYQDLNAGYLRHVTGVRRLPGVTQGAAGTATGGTAASSARPSTGGAVATRPRPTGGGSTSTPSSPGGGGHAATDDSAGGQSSGALATITDAITDASKPFTSLGTFADNLDSIFSVSMVIRVVCGILGLFFLGFGIVLLAREAK